MLSTRTSKRRASLWLASLAALMVLFPLDSLWAQDALVKAPAAAAKKRSSKPRRLRLPRGKGNAKQAAPAPPTPSAGPRASSVAPKQVPQAKAPPKVTAKRARLGTSVAEPAKSLAPGDRTSKKIKKGAVTLPPLRLRFASTVAPVPASAATPWHPDAKASQGAALPAMGPRMRRLFSSHGRWQRHARYGWVWYPAVPRDFAPYLSHGRWRRSPARKLHWQSHYPWGRVAFHYGRWFQGKGGRWAWRPGRRFAPAWVVWRSDSKHILGWAPAPASDDTAYQPLAFWFINRGRVLAAKPARWVVKEAATAAKMLRATKILRRHFRASSKHLEPASPSLPAGHASGAGASRIRRGRSWRRPVRLTLQSPRRGRSATRRGRRSSSRPAGARHYRCESLAKSPWALRCRPKLFPKEPGPGR